MEVSLEEYGDEFYSEASHTYSDDSQSDTSLEDLDEVELIDSDMEELYESFEYEDQASQTSAPARVERGHGHQPPRKGSGVIAPQYAQPVYDHASLSIMQSYLLIFQYAVCHTLTIKAFTELLQLISVHMPQGASVPKSVHCLKQFFLKAFPHTVSSTLLLLLLPKVTSFTCCEL